MPDGSRAWMCGRWDEPVPCVACGREATKLCDFPVDGGTCDRAICDECATQVGGAVLRPVAPGSRLMSSARRVVRRRTGKNPKGLESAVEDTVDHCPEHAR